MNLLLLESAELEALPGGLFAARLADRRAEHVATVLKAAPGQEIRVGVIAESESGEPAWPAGARGVGKVLESAPALLVLEVALEAALPPPPLPRVDLALALPRPQGLHRILQAATVMEVGRIDLFRSYRVEKSYFSSPSLRPEEIRRQLLLGAEQGLRTRLPPVAVHPRLRPLLDDPGLLRPDEIGLLAHPGGVPLEEEEALAAAGDTARRVLAVGPEGGFVDHEVAAFTARGFVAVDLGPWVLRTETAVIAALAQLGLLARARRRSLPGSGLAAC